MDAERGWNQYATSAAPASSRSSIAVLDLLALFPIKFVLAALILLLPALPALAVDISVDATCSLANAIRSANGEAQVSPMDSCETGSPGSGEAGADKIIISAVISHSAGTVLPTITSHVTITKSDSVDNVSIQNAAIVTSAESNLTFTDVNMSDGGSRNPDLPALTLGGNATIRSVLFSNSINTAIRGIGEDAVYTLEDISIYNTGAGWTWPSAVWAQAGSFSFTDLAVTNMYGGLALFRIDAGASIRLAGCKSIFNVTTYITYGAGRRNLMDVSDGVCTRNIANHGHGDAPVRAAPDALACGFPDARWMNLPDNAGQIVYTLTADCTLTTMPLVIPSNARVLIRSAPGQRFSITTSHTNPNLFYVAGRLTLRDVELIAPTSTGFHIFMWVTPPGKLVVEDSIIRAEDLLNTGGNYRLGIYSGWGDITFNRVTMRDFALPSAYSAWTSGIVSLGPGRVTIRDSIIRDNSGGQGAIGIYHNQGGYLHLLGMNTFTGNSPAGSTGINGIYDPHGLLCDESTGVICVPRPQPAADPQEEESAGPRIAPTPRPMLAPAQTCLMLAPAIVVSNASAGTACRLVQPSGYGHHDLIAAMPSVVVDIWGWVTPDTQVCFLASSGAIRFVDTTVSPRTIATLPAFGLNGMVCATIAGAGQVALVAGPVPPTAASDSATDAGATVPMGQSLSGCMVRTNYMLNLRDAPAGERIGAVPYDVTLTALERTVGWFKVDYHGLRGWIAAMYVEPIGTCG